MYVPKGALTLLERLLDKAHSCRLLCDKYKVPRADRPSEADCGLASETLYAAVEAAKYQWAEVSAMDYRVALRWKKKRYYLRISDLDKRTKSRELRIHPTLALLIHQADFGRRIRKYDDRMAVDRHTAAEVEKLAANLIEFLPTFSRDEDALMGKTIPESEQTRSRGRLQCSPDKLPKWWLGSHPLDLSTQQRLFLLVLTNHYPDPDPISWDSVRAEEKGITARNAYDVFHANGAGPRVWKLIDTSGRRYKLKTRPTVRDS